MKKLLALTVAVSLLLSCFIGCGATIKEYDETPLTSLTYTHVDYNGGFTTEYFFVFDKNTVTLHSYLPTDEEHDRMETLAEFTDEEDHIIPVNVYKDPKTDRDTGAGFKKSQRGCCIVRKEGGEYVYTDGHDWPADLVSEFRRRGLH